MEIKKLCICQMKWIRRKCYRLLLGKYQSFDLELFQWNNINCWDLFLLKVIFSWIKNYFLWSGGFQSNRIELNYWEITNCWEKVMKSIILIEKYYLLFNNGTFPVLAVFVDSPSIAISRRATIKHQWPINLTIILIKPFTFIYLF